MNSSQTWIQTFGYDRYGNRTSHSETVGSQSKPINEVTLPSIDPATNRFSNTANYQFDAVGNLIRDAHGRQFVFNGDNKQVQVRDAQNNVVGEYVYDGNAKRIKKITASEYVVFVYDGFGKLIGEYSTAGPPQDPMVRYTATDPLGSPRVLTNENGEIISRRDFMPFGEEIAPDTNHRTAALKYGTGDNVRQKFTGYERDEETGLDFAEARYYYNNHGRFTAVDPLLASGKSANPQTFNRYAYTMNRPLIFTDATGLQTGSKPEDKQNQPGTVNMTGWTFTRTEVKEMVPSVVMPRQGTTFYTEVTRVVETDFVPTSNEVNAILTNVATEVARNEFDAGNRIQAIQSANGVGALDSISLSVGSSSSISTKLTEEPTYTAGPAINASAVFKVTNVSDVESAKNEANGQIVNNARKQLEAVQTVATGSPNVARRLTTSEINGLLTSSVAAGKRVAQEQLKNNAIVIEGAEKELRENR